jgi:hypothetical protein
VSDYELSITEGTNTVRIIEGDLAFTLGLAVPITSLLGTPPDGSFADGQVSGWSHTTTIAQAVDELNEALKGVADSAGGDIVLGAPTDGSFADGYVTTLTPQMRPVDAVDLLNEGLLEVSTHEPTFSGLTGNRDAAAGLAGPFNTETHLADAMHDLNVEAQALELELTDTQAALELLDPIARAPGQQPLGTPAGGWGAGYAALVDATPISAGINALNVGLGQVSAVANEGATDLAALISNTAQEITGIHQEIDTVTALANAPGQQPAGAASGGWQPGHSPLGPTTHITDGLNILNQGLGAVSTTAAAPGTQAAGTPAGGWSTGYAALNASTPINGALNLLNAGMASVNTTATGAASAASAAAATAAAPGGQAAGTPAGGWSTGYAVLTAATAINAGLNTLNAGLAAVNTTATGAASAAASAASTAAAPGNQAAGTPSGGWSAGYAALTASTVINTALNLLNTGLASVNTTATGAATLAAAPGSQAAGTPAGGWSAGYAALNALTTINGALNLLNAGMASVNTTATNAATAASAAASTAAAPGSQAAGTPAGGWSTGYAAVGAGTAVNAALNLLNAGLKAVNDKPIPAALTGTPTDGSFDDGLISLSATATVADSIDNINEAAAGILQNAYTFNTVTNAAAAAYGWVGRARLWSASDGAVSVTNAANTLPGLFQAGLFQVASADGAVQFGNSGKTNGLAIGNDTVALKVAGTTALSWANSAGPVGTLAGILGLSRAGTAAAPTLGFGGTDGLFAPATGELGIATGGAQRIRINAAGNMGIGGADPVTGTVINMTTPNVLSTEYTISIINSAADRWLRWRNDGRLMVQPYMQCNNVVLGIWGNSAIGNTTGSMLDFSNNIATTPVSLVSAASMSVNPTFLVNAKSSASTLDLMRWQQNGTTVVTMANGGALSGPGFYPNTTQATAGTVVWGDSALANGMGVNTTTNSLTLRTATTDALVIDNTQSVTLAAAASLLWNGRGGFASIADGTVQIKNAAATAGTLQLGPSSTSGVRLTSGSSNLSILTGTGSSAVTVTANRYNATSAYVATLGNQPSGGVSAWTRTAYYASITLTGASSTTTSVSFPSGFMLVGVITLVGTTVTGSGLTGFNIGDTGTTAPLLSAGSLSATAFGANLGPTSAAYTSGVKDYAVTLPRFYGAGTLTLTITPVGAATFTAGVVNVTYIVERSI